MTIKIEILGTKETQQFLKNANQAILNKTNQAVVQAGFYIEGEVKDSIAGQRAEPRSVDTGRFLNSVKSVNPSPFTASIETNVPYAQHLEYGTSRMRARHHFTNTKTRNEKKIKEFIENAVKAAVRGSKII